MHGVKLLSIYTVQCKLLCKLYKNNRDVKRKSGCLQEQMTLVQLADGAATCAIN